MWEEDCVLGAPWASELADAHASKERTAEKTARGFFILKREQEGSSSAIKPREEGKRETTERKREEKYKQL